MFLSEHVLYGSSRLGTATYNQKMGYASGSLAYPAGSGFNVCYTESDEVESDREPMGGQTTGPIGGGTMETIKPYGPHKVPDTRVPIVGVNLPWAGGGDVTTKPTKQPTTFVPGRRRYEFSNHLGNVLVTVSDKPMGVDADNNGTAEYYMPDVKTTSDYEPFGAPLAERTLTDSTEKSYRFAFNGKEKDDEWNGDGAMYDYGFRIYDPRIGRFSSIDPFIKHFSYYSSYQYAGNTPISAIDLDGLQIVNGAYKYANDGTRLALRKGYSQEMADLIDATIDAVHRDDEALFNFVNQYDVDVVNGNLEDAESSNHYGLTTFNRETYTTTWPNEASRLMDVYGENYWNEERDRAIAEDEINGNTVAFDAYEKRAKEAFDSGPVTGQGTTKVKAVITIDFEKIQKKYAEFAGDIETSKSTSTYEKTTKHEFGHFFIDVKFFLHLNDTQRNSTENNDTSERNARSIGNTYDGKPETQTDIDSYQMK